MGEFFVWSTFAGFLFTFFPVFLWLDTYVDIPKNRAWFSLSLYRHIKIFGGYGQLDREGVAIHLTKETAVFIPYDKMADTRKKFEITKGFQLWRFLQTVETGGADSIGGIIIAAALQSLGGGTFACLRTRHPFLSLKNDTLLGEKACLKLSVEAATVFNGFVLGMAFTKKALEAILKWIRKRRSTAFLKKQRSN